MASSIVSLFYSILLSFAVSANSSGIEVKLEPNGGEIRKYIGDELVLTCSVVQGQPSDAKYKMNWVLPINGINRVETDEEGGLLRLAVTDLHETDGGNYTCSIEAEHESPVRTSVKLIVLPRGMVRYCSSDSFRCTSGECIQTRYKCDGKPDCLDGSDERKGPEFCGEDVCADKLKCDDNRCLPASFCCREKDGVPPNCTIKPSISCCKQLIHPAILDQDLYYIQARPRLHQQWNPQPDSTLIMGCIVAIANLVTVGIIVGVRYHLWRSNGSSSRAHYHWNRLRSATFRPFGLGSNSSPPSTTDQYQLRSADSMYNRGIPGLRSELLAPEILREQRQQCSRQHRPFSGGVVLYPPTHIQPPQYSQLPETHPGPPPAYHQVVGAPPPPYSSRDDLTMSSSTDGSSLSLLSPLLTNNNNGDINGNSVMGHLSIIHNQNRAHASTLTSTPTQLSGSHNRGNK